MRKGRIEIVVLCEDLQQQTFAYRFLKKAGMINGKFRAEVNYKGRGSGENYVRKNFVTQLKYYRSRQATSVLIVIIDGDTKGVKARMEELKQECNVHKEPFRRDNEVVMIAIPTRNIETWIYYLEGNAVDESTSYRKLRKQSDCQSAVNQLSSLCRTAGLANDAPESLVAACEEYRERVKKSLRN